MASGVRTPIYRILGQALILLNDAKSQLLEFCVDLSQGMAML